MTRLLVERIDYADAALHFERLASAPGLVFLDSSRAGGPLGRYSFLAADPFRTLSSRDGVIHAGGDAVHGDPFAVLDGWLARYPVETEPGLPPFQTGAAGYFGYDLGQHLERIPPHRVDDQPVPDLLVGLYGWTVAFDHEDRRAWVMANGHPESSDAEQRRLAVARIAWVLDQLATPAPVRAPKVRATPRPDLGRAEYEAEVGRVIDYVRAGDIYQANLSHRFRATLPPGADPRSLYMTLRRETPAPFAAFVRHGDVAILSASPERFLALRGDLVEARPIKGTRPRGRTAEEDAALAHALVESEKDRAENLMIVDLLRNDLSRVCADGSVDVPVLFGLETYASVHHLVSVVTGKLRPGKTAVDLLRATFPAGSVTGAPKIRAMEIIAELERNRRGPYCGSVGYIGFDGAMDTSVVIRTMVLTGRQLTFQVGGGIVADSDPSAEYEETLTKAKGLIAALSGAGA